MTQHTKQLLIHFQEFKGWVSYMKEKNKRITVGKFSIENLEDKIEKQEFENVDLEMVTSEEKFNQEDEKEVSNTEQKSNKNNSTLVAVETNFQTVEELEANDKENMIFEGFSSKANSFEIDSLNTVLSKIEVNIFFGFTANGEVHLLVAIFDFLSQVYPFDHNIFVQNVGGWFGHTPLKKFISFFFFASLISFCKTWDEFSFWRSRIM